MRLNVTDARLPPSGKVFASIALLIISVIGSDKKLLVIFTSLGNISSLPDALFTLILY